MPAAIPTTEPSALIAGDTWKWTRSFGDYPASDGWALRYDVVGPEEFEISGSSITGSGSSFAVVFQSDASLPAGTYQWFARVSKANERYTVARGVFTLEADAPDQLFAEKMVAAIDAVIANRIPADVEMYAIGGRSITKMSSSELRRWRAYWKNEVARARRGGQLTVPVRASFGNQTVFPPRVWGVRNE